MPFPATVPEAPSITHSSACTLGSTNPPQSTLISIAAKHDVTPASKRCSTIQLRQSLNGWMSERAEAPEQPGSPSAAGRVPPHRCTGSFEWRLQELAAPESDQHWQGVKAQSRQAETPARLVTRRSPRAGLQPRGRARTPTPGQVSAVSRP